MTPEETLGKMNSYLDNLRYAKNHATYVGLPKDKVGGEIYGDGNTIISIGAIHEFGAGSVPQRSFLRVPFNTKRKDIDKTISLQFSAVFEKGKDAESALNIIGAKATNISKGAFTTQGYGSWSPLKPETIAAKGSSQILIDTGILRNSITWSVRNAS